jgi:hypothetical protein
MSDLPDDVLWRPLAGLTPVVPDPVYSAKVRARCHAALARRHRGRDARALGSRGRTLEVVVVAGFAFVYVVAVVLDALASYGVL